MTHSKCLSVWTTFISVLCLQNDEIRCCMLADAWINCSDFRGGVGKRKIISEMIPKYQKQYRLNFDFDFPAVIIFDSFVWLQTWWMWIVYIINRYRLFGGTSIQTTAPNFSFTQHTHLAPESFRYSAIRMDNVNQWHRFCTPITDQSVSHFVAKPNSNQIF